MTDDPEAVLNYAADGAQKCDSALVTLVEIRGGAAPALDAQMAVRADGSYCGYLSGGCAEAAVAMEAIEALRQGTDRYLRLGEGSDFFDITLPCGGGRKRIALGYNPEVQSIVCLKPPDAPSSPRTAAR